MDVLFHVLSGRQVIINPGKDSTVVNPHQSLETRAAVSARGLVTNAGQGCAGVTGLDLDIEPGRLTTLVGGPRSGAADLLFCLSGHSEPAEGQLWVFGTELSALAPGPRRAFRTEHIGTAVDQPRLLDYLSIEQNLALRPDAPATVRALRELGAEETLGLLPQQATPTQLWTVGFALALSRDYDLTIATLPEQSALEWIRRLRRMVELQGRTVLVQLDNPDPRLTPDRAVRFHENIVIHDTASPHRPEVT